MPWSMAQKEPPQRRLKALTMTPEVSRNVRPSFLAACIFHFSIYN